MSFFCMFFHYLIKYLLVKSNFHKATFVPLLLNSVEIFNKGTKETNGRQTCFTPVLHMESVSCLHWATLEML